MKAYWEEERKNHKPFESVSNNLDVSVCVIGGGLTGLSTAYYLSKNTDVIVVEKDEIGSKTSGKNTGKVTSQHGLFYKYLIESNGIKYAKKYLEANEKAIKSIEDIILKEEIDCDFEIENSYVFTQKETNVDKLKKEQKAVEKLNKNISEFVEKVPLPLEVKGAIEFKNQAKMNPVKYCYGLARSILKNNGRIFENSKVSDIRKKNGRYEVIVNKNKITADYVVIATRYPIMKVPGYYFLKMYQSTSFAIVVDPKEKLFDGMYINCEEPQVSFRKINEKEVKAEVNKKGFEREKELLQIVGYDYKTGTDSIKNGYLRLEQIARKMYPNLEVLYKWSAEDCITLDKIPYIGEFSSLMPNVYVIAGFNKWGLTSSNIAANIIKDKILKNDNEYEDLFNSKRMNLIKNRQEVENMLKEANKSILLSKFKTPKEGYEDIEIGEGKIIELNNEKVGVYKSNTGEIFKVKPICPHLGCELYFNNIDKIWECPCHGSKFTCDGNVIEVPSNKDLEKY